MSKVFFQILSSIDVNDRMTILNNNVINSDIRRKCVNSQGTITQVG